MTKIRIPQRLLNKTENVKKILEILATDENIVFRGGTALSMTYEVIERFSEDIDISLMNMSVMNPDKLREWLEGELKECDWVTNIEWIKEKHFLNVKFDNSGIIEKGFEAFVDNVITIELPKEKRRPDEIAYSKMAPFSGALFEMNVMNIENIFSDKIAIVFEYFMRHAGFSWIELDPKLSRHIYDVQMLMEKETNYKTGHIEKRMKKLAKNYIVSPKQTHIDKGARIVEALSKETNDKVFEKFINELNKSWPDIEKGVSNLVYPNAEDLNKRVFIDGYERLFRKLLSTLKKQKKILEDETISPSTSQ